MKDDLDIIDTGARETNVHLAGRIEKLEQSIDTLYIGFFLAAVALVLAQRWLGSIEERLVKLELLK